MAAPVPYPNDPSTVARAAIKHRQGEDVDIQDHNQAIDTATEGSGAIALIPQALRYDLIQDADASHNVMKMPPGTVPALHALTDHAKGNLDLIHCALKLAILDRPEERKLMIDGRPGIPPLTPEDVFDALVNVLKHPELDQHLDEEYRRGLDDGYADRLEDMKPNVAGAMHEALRELWSGSHTVATVSIHDFVNGIVERTWKSLEDGTRCPGDEPNANRGDDNGNAKDSDDVSESCEAESGAAQDGEQPAAEAVSPGTSERLTPGKSTDAVSPLQATARSFSTEEVEKLIRQSYQKGRASVFSDVENLKHRSCKEGGESEGGEEPDFETFIENALQFQPSNTTPAEELQQPNEGMYGPKAQHHKAHFPKYITVEAALKLTTSNPERLAVPGDGTSQTAANERDHGESPPLAHGAVPDDALVGDDSLASSRASVDVVATDAPIRSGESPAVESAHIATRQETPDQSQQQGAPHSLPQTVRPDSSAPPETTTTCTSSTPPKVTTPTKKAAKIHREEGTTTGTKSFSNDASPTDHVAQPHEKTTPPCNGQAPLNTATPDLGEEVKVAKATDEAASTPSRTVDSSSNQPPDHGKSVLSASSTSSNSAQVVSGAGGTPTVAAVEQVLDLAHATPRPNKRARQSGRGTESPSDRPHETPDGKRSRRSSSPAEKY